MGFEKFLDEDNIITKEENVEDVELSFEDDAEEEEPVKEVKKEKPKKRKIPKATSKKQEEQAVAVNKSAIKSRKEIIADVINRYQEQKIVKEIELEMRHYMYGNANNNDERKRYDMEIKNLAKEIRTLDKKLQFLEKKYKEE